LLSAAVWEAAAAERRSRAERTHAKRAWSKTDDPERAVVTESEEVING
jgi:hypothetical protein